MQRFRGGLVFKARTRCVSLKSRLESDKEEEEHLMQTYRVNNANDTISTLIKHILKNEFKYSDARVSKQ